MIIKNAKLSSVVKLCLLVAVSTFVLPQCSEEEIIAPANQNAVQTDANISTEEADIPVSLSVSGIHNFSPETVDCKTCKYVVASNVSVVDGEKLGIKAGDIICLDAAIKYKSIEFININGTIEKPVVIANCDSRIK